VSKDDIIIRIASFLFVLPLLPPSLSQIKEEKMFTKEKIGAPLGGEKPKASISSWVEFRIVCAQNKEELER
jgi:hypothetical protein